MSKTNHHGRSNGKKPHAPAREWVSFADPVDEGRTWQIDVTFLLSSWECIFGRGCQGVYTEPTPELVQGCCTYGAHFSDKDDLDHVSKAARRLGPDTWQFARIGKKKGIFAKVGKNDDGTADRRTRLVKGACIFLNRPGFANGPGCAFHQQAERDSLHHSDLKPEVCWQLPLRRIDDEQDDGTVVSRLTEFGRDGWGEGGDDFGWWCTEEAAAFAGAQPVYQSMAVELRKMLGKALAKQVVAYLDGRRRVRTFPPVSHPAEVPVTIGRRSR
ncbi:MAG: hypothetical protein ACHQDE_02425 [Acidimicrobiia bacterium]